MQDPEINLRKNGFGQFLDESVRDIGTGDSFTDVTLACDGNKAIKAHKIILSMFSPVLKDILLLECSKTPYIYFKGVKFETLTSIIQFIYLGEVTLPALLLDEFVKFSKELKIKDVDESVKNDNSSIIYRLVCIVYKRPSPPLFTMYIYLY